MERLITEMAGETKRHCCRRSEEEAEGGPSSKRSSHGAAADGHDESRGKTDLGGRGKSVVVVVPNKESRAEDSCVRHFLGTLKAAYTGREEAAREFVGIMEDLTNTRIDYHEMSLSVHELFKPHPHLLRAFENIVFSPPTPPPAEERDFRGEAADFLDRAKEGFRAGCDHHSYKEFLETILLQISGGDPTAAMIHSYPKVASLFRGHRALLGEYTGFLPESLEVFLWQQNGGDGGIIAGGPRDYGSPAEPPGRSIRNEGNRRHRRKTRLFSAS